MVMAMTPHRKRRPLPRRNLPGEPAPMMVTPPTRRMTMTMMTIQSDDDDNGNNDDSKDKFSDDSFH
jgi:hypothetical protein